MKILQCSFNPDIPYFIPDADFIGMNAFHLHDASPNVVGWIQIHREEDLGNEDTRHIQWLKQKHDFPIYMIKKFSKYPASVPMPRDSLVDLWPYNIPVSFSCSFSWAVALGIYLGYDKIVFYNTALATPREAYLEAPNLMLWVGAAKVHGVDVRFIDSRLEEVYNYGYEPRGIPTWLPTSVVLDVIADYVSPEARVWRKVVEVYQRAKIYNKIITKEFAQEVMERWLDEVDTNK